MLIHYDEDEYETVVTRRICAFHKQNPGEPSAGCTCSTSIGYKKRSLDEIASIKAKRQREYEDKVLAEAERIRAVRALKQEE